MEDSRLGYMVEDENKKFVFSILKIILLTNIPALIMLIPEFKSSIGWMTGSLASAVNFWFMAQKALQLSPENSHKANAIKTSKVFVFRYAFLIGWSAFVLVVIKPELIAFCLGLLAAQLAVVLYHVYNALTKGVLGKYYDRE